MAIAWALGRKANSESKESDRMLPQEADIDAHIKWLENKEAIYFDHTWSCRIEGPINGYLYIFHEPSPTWIKVSKICKLSPLIYDSTKIIKWRDSKPLESFIPPLRSRAYIVDGNWKCGK